MIFFDLNASEFGYNYTFYKKEFESIIEEVIACYNKIVLSKLQLPDNENNIRDIMLTHYLKNESFKKEHSCLINYHFDSETIENKGRADIRVLPINPYINDEAYFIFECKRLNAKNLTGDTGLNAEYIKNGICRFVTNYYSTYFGLNGMIGFVFDNVNIDQNIENINMIIKKNFINDKNISVNANVLEKITKIQLLNNFNFTYISKHNSVAQKQITLYHLMFDFSNNT